MPPRKRARAPSAADAPKARRVKAEPAEPAAVAGPDEIRARFPPTIVFEDPFANGAGVYVKPPSDWNDSGDRAAARVSREVRLLGTATVTVRLAGAGEGANEGEARETSTSVETSSRSLTKKKKVAREGEDATPLGRFLTSLAHPVRASHRRVWCDHRHGEGAETWNAEGEPGNDGGLVPVNRLYEALDAGAVVFDEPHAPRLVASLAAAQHPHTSPWRVPLIRAVCVLGDAEGSPEKDDDAATDPDPDPSRRVLTFAAYANRLMFELIACDEIKYIVAHLTPSAPVEHAVAAPPARERMFEVDADAAGVADDFTLPGLLAAAVTRGGAAAPQPPGLKVRMLDFQLQTLRWMRDQERAPRGLNGSFWEERRWADAAPPADDDENDEASRFSLKKKGKTEKKSATSAEGRFWYFPLAGELRLAEPPVRRGGMLCEEMGLGKTVEVLGLVCADKEAAASEAAARAERAEASRSAVDCTRGDGESAIQQKTETPMRQKTTSRATLVVVPPPLLRQWEAETRKCVAEETLAVKVYQGNRGQKRTHATNGANGEKLSAKQREDRRVAELADADVVLCTYPQLQREASKARRRNNGGGAERDSSGVATSESRVLSRIKWRRVVLDECQMVRSSTTQLAAACRDLESEFRWMVSGTPLHGGVDDLNGELDFLGVWPFCLSDQTDGFWAHRIGVPFANRDAECLPLLHALLRGVVVRHTKAQRRVADGSPLLTLPSAARELRAVRHGAAAHEAPSERFVCSFLEHHASVAARGALRVLLNERAASARGGAGSGARTRSARALATRLLRMVRGATTSATLVRARLRDVEEAMRHASTSGAPRDGHVGRWANGASLSFRDAAGQLDASAVEAAAAEDVRRVRALPAGLALLELMAPREANASGPTAARRSAPSAGGRAASAFALRNADMRSFEADRQAWRGTSREYADAGGADLAHKLADVADGLLKILRNAAERHRRGDADAAARADRVPGVAARLAEAAARREAARARLHRLQHAFPGRLAKLCACAGWTCGCRAFERHASGNASEMNAPGDLSPPPCCASAAAFTELARADNRAARAREATQVASAADAAARDAVAAARAPLPKLRWLLAVELITSGAAFERFRAAAKAREAEPFGWAARDPNAAGRDADANVSASRATTSAFSSNDSSGRLSVRFLRRAFLAARLDGLVASADAAADVARAAAQDRDPADPLGKPRRAIARAPEHVQEAYRDAVAAARDARARRRDETPGGVRFDSGTTAGVSCGGAALLELVIPRLARKNDAKKNKNSQTIALSAHAALEALYEALDRARARSALLAEEIGALAPYARALAAAGASTDFAYDSRTRFVAEHASVKQGGFALIDEIALGKTTPQCCICCAPARAPTITRCMHLACARCVVTWFHAAPMHGAAAAAGGAPCPLCRKPFHIEDLIRVMPNEEASRERRSPRGRDASSDGDDDASLSDGGRSGKGDERKGKGAKRRASSRDGEDETSLDETSPKFSSAATPASFARLPLPPGEDPGDHRDGRYPALSMDGGRFLAHVHRACMRQSPKIAALVADLREHFARPGASGKAVVFSQLRDALVCAAEALTWEGVGNALVDGNAATPAASATLRAQEGVVRPEDAAARAVARFRDDPACRVLLLHAGSAAAGLTLTHADLVILLEPFLSPGDEAQAANRVHRIGQTRAVRCVTYFVRGTVEERLLAFRTRQAEFGGEVVSGGGTDAGDDGAAGVEGADADASSAAALGVIRDAGDAFAASMSRAQFDRMRFIFGLSDRGAASGGANESDDEREGRETPR